MTTTFGFAEQAKKMRPSTLLTRIDGRRMGLILLALFTALAAGLVFLVYPTPYAPLLVGAAFAGVAGAVTLFLRPVLALYAAVFVVLLPIGLIPPEIHSLLNRSAAMLALGTWVFDVIARHRRITWTSTSLLMLAFVGWSSLTLAWSVNTGDSVTILQAYVLRFILFLMLLPNQINTKARLDGLMATLALNGFILVVITVATMWTGGYDPGTRLRLVEANENSVGILALLTMQGVLWQVVQIYAPPSKLKRLFVLVFLVLAVALIAATGSRGSAISLAVVLLTLWLWKPTRGWTWVALLIIALGLALTPFLFATTFERFAVESRDAFLGGREVLWEAGVTLGLEHPWQGVGIGNASRAVRPYVSLLRSVWLQETVSVHNPVLAIWIETGFPGLFLYLGVLITAVWLFVREYVLNRRLKIELLVPYYALVSATFLGYMLSWIKGGGMESDFTYFLVLALMLIPSSLSHELKSHSGSMRRRRASDSRRVRF